MRCRLSVSEYYFTGLSAEMLMILSLFLSFLLPTAAWLLPSSQDSHRQCRRMRHDSLVTSCTIAAVLRVSETEDASFLSEEEEGTFLPVWETDDDGYDDAEGQDSLSLSSMSSSLEKILLDEYTLWRDSVSKSLKFLERKLNSLENELRKAEKVEETLARAHLLRTHLYRFTPGVRSAVVQDWENDGADVTLTLDPSYDCAAAEVDALFQQARKVRRGSQVVSDLKDQTFAALSILREIMADLECTVRADDTVVDEDRFRLAQDRLLQTARQTQFEPPTAATHDDEDSGRKTLSRHSKHVVGTPSSNVRKLVTPAGNIILVGRNRRGNEYISMTLAKDKDIWMHARGCPGAHVLIMQRRGSNPLTEDCLQLAANLAVFYSDARTERRADVTVAEPKHVLKPRNAPIGAVKLRQELRVLLGNPDDVPEDFKQARQESGQSAEYRVTDKAKHRKKTQKAANQRQKKVKSKRQKECNIE